jgi:hypothetical protein
VRRTQLCESLTSTSGGVGMLDRLGEQGNNLVVAPEVDEVFERQVDRTDYCTSGTQVAKLVELSLTAGHATTIHPRPDAPLHFD